MIKNIYIVSILFILFLASCSKVQDSETLSNVQNMNQLQVDQDFEWSAGMSGTLYLTFQNPNNVSTELEIINIVDDNDKVIKSARIKDNQAEFALNLPQNSSYYVYFPVTGDKVKINSMGDLEMELGETIVIDPLAKSGADVTTCTSCNTPIENAGGEQPVINSNYKIVHQDQVPGWKTTASDKRIEIWRSGFQGIPAQEGNQFFELNANMVADLYQELCLEPGAVIHWSVWHRGRLGVDVAEVKIGGTIESAEVQEVMSDGNNAWGHYEGSYTVPEDQTITYFVFTSVSSQGSASYGNFLDNFEITCDFDGDGIPDHLDDDPGNPDVAFITNFPTSGKQVVAFEDLWPSTGDFDFNDIVLSNQATIFWDANFKPVKADFIISIDAIGATIHNGIGMMFYDENKQSFGNNVIETVTGDAALDPDVTNGIILSEDVFETISQYYQNNGLGPKAIPDTLNFTINFSSSAAEFIPELFIFRSDDRTYEIHRSEFNATAVMDQSLFNTLDDNGHYKTSSGLPWGLEIILDGHYKNPVEKVDMLLAYPDFQQWAVSGGAENTTWYENPVEENVVDIFAK